MKITETFSNFAGTAKEQLRPTVKVFGESKTVQILSSVFVLQLVVAGGLLWKSNSQAQFSPATQLVNIDPSTVDEIMINDGDDTVSLVRTDEQWRMNDENTTLAAVDKIEKLVSDIAALKPGLPVTSTRGAHQQLEVADDNFQRHVLLKSGDEIVTDLYMGTSPGFRKSHVRQSGQDQVFSARLNTFDIPAGHEDWLDKNLLSFDNVNGLQMEDIDLAFADEQWSIVTPEDRIETHKVDKTGVDSVVGQLKALRVNGFAKPLEADESNDVKTADDATEPSEAEELLTHTITIVQNDVPVSLILSKLGSDVTVERSDIQGLFSLPIATFEALKPEVLQQLIVTKQSGDSQASSQPQG